MSESASARLSLTRLLTFASPAVPIAALGLPVAVYLPNYYGKYTALSFAEVGILLMICRFWDVFTDPVLGWLSDRSESKWGRRRPWIVLSVPFVVISTYMVFLSPEDAGGTYLLGWMFLMYVGWTMLTISHMSWAAELSDDYDERSRIQGAREGALILGALLVLAIPFLFANIDPQSDAHDHFAAMGLFVIILLPFAVGASVSMVKETKAPPPPQIPILTALKTMMRHKPLRTILWVDLIGGLSGGTVAVLFLPLANNVFGLSDVEAGGMLLVYFLSGVLFVPVIVRLAYRFGKHRTLAVASLINAFTVPFIFFMPPGDIVLITLLWGILGINLGAGALLIRAMTADIIDMDQIETGAQRTGVFYALINMTTKLGYAVAVGSAGFLLELFFGFDLKAETHSAEALFGLKLVYVVMPVAVAIVAFFLLWNFPLDKGAQERLRKAIAEREALLRTAPDPANSPPEPAGDDFSRQS